LFYRTALALGVVLFWLGSGSQARPLHGRDRCFRGRGRIARSIRSVQVRITPGVDKDALNEPNCHLVVRDLDGNVILSETDSSFEVLLDSKDMNGDGIPDLVLEAYSGGARCCWTYYIFSLASTPSLITKFENEREASFDIDEKRGTAEIVTLDGAFDYFDGLCHACTPFPLVYLRLNGNDLVDLGPQHLADYDETIRENKNALTASELHSLQTAKGSPTTGELAHDTTAKALGIVLAYLYGGRTDQAYEALQKMWPAFDQARVWKLIQDTRSGGILSYTRSKTRELPLATVLSRVLSAPR